MTAFEGTHSDTPPGAVSKLEALLARVANLKQVRDLKPTTFDQAGEAHARQVAQQDRNTQ